MNLYSFNDKRSHNTYVQRCVNVTTNKSDSAGWHDLVLPMSDGELKNDKRKKLNNQACTKERRLR